MSSVNVLIVDDSALVRQVLLRGLSRDPEIRVVGTAGDPYKAQELINERKPDVLTLDIEMPRMNGLLFLKRLMRRSPMPVIMVSALTERGSRITLEALASGAVDFILKPTANIRQSLTSMMEELRTKIKVAAKINRHLFERYSETNRLPTNHRIETLHSLSDKIIAIGASTGGPQALRTVLGALPANAPATLVVQHMPAGFTEQLARRLNDETALNVKEARSGDPVVRGQVLIAPGDYHLQLVRHEGVYRVICRKGARMNGHRPSVDVLFRSVAKYAGANAIGVMLTGMGDDGADAMAVLRKTGAFTLAQDAHTSVVFGMPKEAYLRGGASRLLPLNEIPLAIVDYLNGRSEWRN